MRENCTYGLMKGKVGKFIPTDLLYHKEFMKEVPQMPKVQKTDNTPQEAAQTAAEQPIPILERD